MDISENSWHYRWYVFVIGKVFIIGEDYDMHPKTLCSYFWRWLGIVPMFFFSWLILGPLFLILMIVASPILLCMWLYFEVKPVNVVAGNVAYGFRSIKNRFCPMIQWEDK